MTTNYRHLGEHLETLFQQGDLEHLVGGLAPRFDNQPRGVPGGARTDLEAVEKRWELLNAPDEAKARLLDVETIGNLDRFQGHTENLIGTVKVPVGIAGPLRVNGLFARGDFYVPLATTEAALVASYSRGSRLITRAGGCSVMLVNEGVGRAPGFAFKNMPDAGRFVVWAVSQVERFKEIAGTTTSHGKLVEMKVNLEGNHVYLDFEYTTGDAAGQNMATIATRAICDYVMEASPVKPEYHFIEANLSGDKKASTQSFLSVRGKKISAEAIVGKKLIRRFLHTSPKKMADYWRMSAMGGVMSGTIGVQGHYANALAALYIACGQDPACVSESAVGMTRLEVTDDGDLRASVTLPNVIVGTIGGGTGLPWQKACLEILGLYGKGKARQFAEVCGAIALAGELSIIGAISAGHFTRAHQRLARGR